MWDGAKCVDTECDERETPSYSLTGQHIITSGLLVLVFNVCLQVPPSACARLAGLETLRGRVSSSALGDGVIRVRYYRSPPIHRLSLTDNIT